MPKKDIFGLTYDIGSFDSTEFIHDMVRCVKNNKLVLNL